MFDIGMQELIVIFVVALLVFGPKKLPELGKTLGKSMAELKRAMYGIKEQMDAEIREVENPEAKNTGVAQVKAEETGKEEENKNRDLDDKGQGK